MTRPASVREALHRTGTFMLGVVQSSDWLAIRADQHQPLPQHETVLRPLLAACEEAWVYELREDSQVFDVARHILVRERGKYRIDLSGEPIRGCELLWNASGGQRGSIALVIPSSRFPGRAIYPHCRRAFVIGNSTVPHSAAAIRLARARVGQGHICCLLSRTNGFEWLSVFAPPSQLEPMLAQARSLVVEHALYENSAT